MDPQDAASDRDADHGGCSAAAHRGDQAQPPPALRLHRLLRDLRPVAHRHHRLGRTAVAGPDGLRRPGGPAGRRAQPGLRDGCLAARLPGSTDPLPGCHRGCRSGNGGRGRAGRPRRAPGAGTAASRDHLHARGRSRAVHLSLAGAQRRQRQFGVVPPGHGLRPGCQQPAGLLLLLCGRAGGGVRAGGPAAQQRDRPLHHRGARQPRSGLGLHHQPEPLEAGRVRDGRGHRRSGRGDAGRPVPEHPLRRALLPDRRLAAVGGHGRDRRARSVDRTAHRRPVGDRSACVLRRQRAGAPVHLQRRAAHHPDVLPGRVRADRVRHPQAAIRLGPAAAATQRAGATGQTDGRTGHRRGPGPPRAGARSARARATPFCGPGECR